MKVEKIGTRGILFTFPGFMPYPQVPMPIQIYVIIGTKYLYICDTGIDTEKMVKLREYLQSENLLSKPIIIFNSHFHLDHVGGNGAFESALIISHKFCQEKMVKTIEKIKAQNIKRLEGKSIAYPSLIFEKKIVFMDDDVEFFYSPGHSEDSSSCYDHVDRILYVGDNLVDPIPFLTWYGFNSYLDTLQNYCNLELNTIILGHKSVFKEKSFIKKTLSYIENFRKFNVDISDFTPQHVAWYRWSFLYLGLDLKEKGMYDEAEKYFKYINNLIRHPKIKPIDDAELKEIEEFLSKVLID
ncbi:MAG: MBL fold metallo-hydrolase [Promethearchaeota archaeon]